MCALAAPSPRPAHRAVNDLRRDLEAELPSRQIIADPDRMERYAEDWSKAGTFLPDLVVTARRTADVQAVLRGANRHGVPVTPRGLGTGKSGGALPICGGVVLSLEEMSAVHEVSRDDMCIVAGAGTITKDVMDAAEAEGLFYPPDPNSYAICSIGGNVACNAGGPRALKYGVTKNYVLELELVLPTGEAMRVGKRTIKHVTGYDLAALLVGSEGTLGVITECTMRLIPLPAAVSTALVSFHDARRAAEALNRMLGSGIVPRTLELLDHEALRVVRQKTPGRFPENAGALFILETDGQDESRAFADLSTAAEICLNHGALDVQVAQTEVQRERIWEPRRVLSVTLSESAPKKISEDVSVPRGRLPELIDRVHRIGENRGVRVAAYGHAGDGNLHVNVLFDEATAEHAERAVEDVLHTAIELGGTISGEHGIGYAKRRFLPWEHSPGKLSIQRALKNTLDPHNILNPGKIWPPEGGAS